MMADGSSPFLQKSINQCHLSAGKLNDINNILSSATDHDAVQSLTAQQRFLILVNNFEQRAVEKQMRLQLWNEQFHQCLEQVEEYANSLCNKKKLLEKELRRQSQAFQDTSKQREASVHIEYQRYLRHLDTEIEQLELEIGNFDVDDKSSGLAQVEPSINKCEPDIYENVQTVISEKNQSVDNLMAEKTFFETNIKLVNVGGTRALSDQENIEATSAKAKSQMLTLLRMLSPNTEVGTCMSRTYSMLLDQQVINFENFMKIFGNPKASNTAIQQLKDSGIICVDPCSAVINFQ